MDTPRVKGFSLIEILIATTIAAGVCSAVFQLFQQNERVFRDQNAIMEMQQAARVAASQITDDIRISGQSVPVYPAPGRPSLTESTVVVLAGSDFHRLNLRAGVSNAEGDITSPYPLQLSIGAPVVLTVANAAAFSTEIGTTPTGRYAYIWTVTDGWARALITAVSGRTKSIGVTAVDGSASTVLFTGIPTIVLEEAAAVFLDTQTRSIRRTTSTNMNNPLAPAWAPASALASNVTDLEFTYYDAANVAVVPNTLQSRSAVARIDMRVVVTTSTPLSTGLMPVHELSTRTTPRNPGLR